MHIKALKQRIPSTNFSRVSGFVIALFTLFLLLRNAGPLPTVMGDEWHYSAFSRLINLRSSPDPDYLYLALFRVATRCGGGYLQCARVLNTAWFVFGAGFIFLLARQFLSATVATLIAIVAIASPINVYTAYFMPESMYFAGFWALSWFISRHYKEGVSYYSVGAGILLALLSLVKPHALFLLPGLVVFITYKSYVNSKERFLAKAATTSASFVLTSLVVKLAGGYLLAGKAGLTLLGHRYTSMASDSDHVHHLIQTLALSATVLWHHSIALVLLFGTPFCILLGRVFSRSRWENGTRGKALSLEMLTLSAIVPLLAATCGFTVVAVGSGPYESLTRLHMRYYDFTFPFLFIIAATACSPNESNEGRNFLKTAAGIAIGAIALYALIELPNLFSPSIADGPELFALTFRKVAFFALGACSFVSLLVWTINETKAAKLFLGLFTPLFLVASLASISYALRQRHIADDYDTAGQIARQFLNEDDRARLLVVGTSVPSLWRTLFYVDAAPATYLQLGDGAAFKASDVPSDRKWLLVIGKHESLANAAEVSSTGHYALLSLNNVDFTKPLPPQTIDRIEGVWAPEPWGTWSIGPHVSFVFHRPLPKRFTMRLTAAAFGPNMGKPFTVTVGPQSKSFRLSATKTTVSLSFDNSNTNRTISIAVPQPTSPKALGIGGDERLLGLQLMKLQIVPEEIE